MQINYLCHRISDSTILQKQCIIVNGYMRKKDYNKNVNKNTNNNQLIGKNGEFSNGMETEKHLLCFLIGQQ